MSDARVGSCLGNVTSKGASADVWFAWCGRYLDEVPVLSRTLLSPEERERYGGYRSRDAAERYVVTRALVRIVLADKLGIEPTRIAVRRTATGKPVLDGDLHFNVTHSGDLILVAVSERRAVGVDVERRRPVPRVSELETRWLTDAERRDVATLRGLGVNASDAFLRVWSLKEARLKALGVGISGSGRAPLEAIDALPLDELLAGLSADDDEPQYVGAIAFA